jgi:NTP pyrophosphatase (non-canonical NTP hydrolase)
MTVIDAPLGVAEYEAKAAETDKLEPPLDTAILGLVGEVGSLVSALKKKRRDTDGYFGYRDAVLEELGDVLWYISAVARRGGTSLAEAFAIAADRGLGSEAVRLDDLAAGALADKTETVFESALLVLAGEAGDLAKSFAGGAYANNVDALRGDLVKLLRPLGRAATATEVSLSEAGRRNLAKIDDFWAKDQTPPPLFDEGCHIDEQLPRFLRVAIYQRPVGSREYVFQKANGLLIGDRLTDNHIPEDDYRFHDVFHLAHTAVLGWSPVIRALLKVKRKSKPEIDENEDGARAVLIEEGLTTWIFETAKRHNFFVNTPQLGLDLLKSVKQFVQGYEAERLPMWLWQRAILQGYAAFRELRANRRGLIIVDMVARELRFEALPPGVEGSEP